MINNWDDLSLSQYQEFLEIKEKYGRDGLLLEYYIECIALLMDIPPDDPYFDSLPDTELTERVKECNWFFNPPKSRNNNINGFIFKSLNHLKLGEYIDLENFMKSPIENFIKICSVLTRKHTKDSWGNIIEEPYTYSIEEREQTLMNLPCAPFIELFESWNLWRNSFLKNYEPLFDGEGSEDDEEEAELKGEARAAEKRSMIEQKVRVQWSWEHLVWSLSGGDVTKIPSILDQNVILVFNMLGMKKTLGV